MDISKFKPSDWLSTGGGLLFVIGYFMDWWGKDLGPISVGVNGSHYFFTGTISFLLFLAIGIIVFLRASGLVKLPNTVPWPLALLMASALGMLLMIIRFIFDGESKVTLDRQAGLFLAFLAAILVTVGRVMGFTEAGGKLDDLKDPSKIKREFGK